MNPNICRRFPPEAKDFVRSHSRLLIKSLLRFRDIPVHAKAIRELTPEQLAGYLFENHTAVVSQGTEENPILNYGNRNALRLWKMDWKEFTSTPSQRTAEPELQEERARILEVVQNKGIIYPYSGIRISGDGRRFLIKDTKIWRVEEDDGTPRGMAAMITDWEML